MTIFYNGIEIAVLDGETLTVLTDDPDILFALEIQTRTL